MNIDGMVVSQLKKRRAAMVERHAKELGPIDAALQAFGGVTAPVTTPVKTRKRRRTQAQIDAIKKAQEARALKFANKKAAEEQTGAGAGETSTKRESHPRLSTGPKGASLAEAAS